MEGLETFPSWSHQNRDEPVLQGVKWKLEPRQQRSRGGRREIDRSPKHTDGDRHGCSRQGLTKFTGRQSPGPRKLLFPSRLGGSRSHANTTSAKRNEVGGEGGIRTHGTRKRTHAFQACSLNHSDTSPDASSIRLVAPRSGAPMLLNQEPFSQEISSIPEVNSRP